MELIRCDVRDRIDQGRRALIRLRFIEEEIGHPTGVFRPHVNRRPKRREVFFLSEEPAIVASIAISACGARIGGGDFIAANPLFRASIEKDRRQSEGEAEAKERQGPVRLDAPQPRASRLRVLLILLIFRLLRLDL